MNINKFTDADLPEMTEIWNEVVLSGNAFPQEDILSAEESKRFFASQTLSAAAKTDTGELVGLYILHPNNVGRCCHIANASYAVKKGYRGMHIGEQLVLDCMARAKESGFKILQFNAVVKTNSSARHLYERLGFIPLGTIPKGFRMKDGHYEDICPYYIEL